MKKTTLNLAVMLLVALGVTACGSKHNETVISTAPNTTAAELAAIQAQLAQANEALTVAEEATSKAEEAASKAEEAARKAEEAVSSAETEAQKAKEALASAQTELASTTSALQAAQNEVQTAKAATEAIQAELTTAQQEIENLKAQLANSTDSAEMATLKAQLENAEEEVATLKAQLTTAESELASANANLTEAEAKLAEAESENVKLKEELATAEEKLANYIKKEKATGDVIAANLQAGGYASDSASYTYAYLNDESKNAALLSTIENNTSNCAEGYKAACVRNGGVADGTIIYSQNQDHSAYAVIRETYNADTYRNSPLNSFVAIVKTPTTDKEAVVDASYSGQSVFTMKNMNTLIGESSTDKTAVLNLNVKDGVVSGAIQNQASADDSKWFNYATFKETEIMASNSSVVFEGEAVFNSQRLAFSTLKDSDGNWIDAEGTYRGAFAGTNAEEVIGTFESNTATSDVSIQGAFRGTKNSTE